MKVDCCDRKAVAQGGGTHAKPKASVWEGGERAPWQGLSG